MPDICYLCRQLKGCCCCPLQPEEREILDQIVAGKHLFSDTRVAAMLAEFRHHRLNAGGTRFIKGDHLVKFLWNTLKHVLEENYRLMDSMIKSSWQQKTLEIKADDPISIQEVCLDRTDESM